MLIVQIHDDGTGDKFLSHYDVRVCITKTPTELETIADCRIENHQRGDGWLVLLKRAVSELETK